LAKPRVKAVVGHDPSLFSSQGAPEAFKAQASGPDAVILPGDLGKGMCVRVGKEGETVEFPDARGHHRVTAQPQFDRGDRLEIFWSKGLAQAARAVAVVTFVGCKRMGGDQKPAASHAQSEQLSDVTAGLLGAEMDVGDVALQPAEKLCGSLMIGKVSDEVRLPLGHIDPHFYGGKNGKLVPVEETASRLQAHLALFQEPGDVAQHAGRRTVDNGHSVDALAVDGFVQDVFEGEIGRGGHFDRRAALRAADVNVKIREVLDHRARPLSLASRSRAASSPATAAAWKNAGSSSSLRPMVVT